MHVLKTFILGSITTLGLLLHLIGSYLQWKTYNWGRITTQQLLIFHLSICECIMNGNWIIIITLTAIWKDTNIRYFGYFFVVYLAVSGIIYKIMMFITVDRLMAVVLNLKYHQYWTVGRTKIATSVIWVIGFTELISFVICNTFLGYWFRIIEVVYFKVVFSFLYILLAIMTYTVIFWKYKISRRLSRSQDVPINDKRNRTSRFYVAVFIILSYLVFNVIPFCTFALSYKGNGDIPSLLEGILLHLGSSADALIYIFLQRNVRKHFFMVCSCVQSTRNDHISLRVTSDKGHKVNDDKAILITNV